MNIPKFFHYFNLLYFNKVNMVRGLQGASTQYSQILHSEWAAPMTYSAINVLITEIIVGYFSIDSYFNK